MTVQNKPKPSPLYEQYMELLKGKRDLCMKCENTAWLMAFPCLAANCSTIFKLCNDCIMEILETTGIIWCVNECEHSISLPKVIAYNSVLVDCMKDKVIEDLQTHGLLNMDKVNQIALKHSNIAPVKKNIILPGRG